MGSIFTLEADVARSHLKKMGSIFTLEADDPQTDTVISKLQKSQVKNTRVLSQTKKPFFQLQSKTKQTKPDQTNNHQKREPKKKETTHFRFPQLTTNFHHSTTYSDDDDDDITHNNATQWQIRTTEDNSQYRKKISLG
jgi:hypothetical protein